MQHGNYAFFASCYFILFKIIWDFEHTEAAAVDSSCLADLGTMRHEGYD
jgi:hypothetical protein